MCISVFLTERVADALADNLRTDVKQQQFSGPIQHAESHGLVSRRDRNDAKIIWGCDPCGD
ncbi:MAG: hypothetical protein KJO13_11930, partial [Gammaproteobacteria bacterium]|nr:hypothetical protein [Gammaproteobacteria bacterium]